MSSGGSWVNASIVVRGRGRGRGLWFVVCVGTIQSPAKIWNAMITDQGTRRQWKVVFFFFGKKKG